MKSQDTSYKLRVKRFLKQSNFFVGTTLIELLLYMGLLTIFMSVLAGLFSSAVDLHLESNATTSVDRDAQFIISRLTYDIERAVGIVAPASLGSTGSTLTLSITGGNISYNTDASGNLVYTTTSGSFTLNSYDVTISDLSFTHYGNLGGVEDNIQVSFTITSQYTQRKGTESRTIQTTIGLRR